MPPLSGSHRATSGYVSPVSDPVGSVATTGLTAVKPGATSRLTRRPNRSVSGASYSQRSAGRHRERRTDPPVVGDVGVVREAAQILVGVAERDRARARNAEQEVGEVGAGRAPVNVKPPRGSCCDRMST